MNCKLINTLLLIISASVLFMAGCGPQDVTDAEFIAQIADEDILNKDGQDAPAPEQAHQGPGHSAGDGCPTGGCPTGNCVNPPEPDTHREVKMPDQYSTQPTKVTPTSEQQLATHVVDYRTTKHVYQPHENHHTTYEHDKTIRRHHTTVVFHPTTRKIMRTVKSASVEDQVMPVQEVVAPLVDHGCAEPPPPPRPVIRPIILRPVPVLMPYYSLFRRFY